LNKSFFERKDEAAIRLASAKAGYFPIEKKGMRWQKASGDSQAT